MTRPPLAPAGLWSRTRVAIVADASDPLGRVVALALADRGHAVLASGRDPAAMHDLPRETAMGGIVEIAPTDLALARAKGHFGRVDALVLGSGTPEAPFVAGGPASLLTPLASLLELLAAAVPHLAGGRIVIVVPPPTATPSATTAALRAALGALVEPLRAELAAQDIKVIAVTTERGRVARRGSGLGPLGALVEKALSAPRPKARYTLKLGRAARP